MTRTPAWLVKYSWTLPFLFALLFWASYHPANLGFLGHVALVPLLIYSQVASGKKAFFLSWAGGYAAFAAGYSWFGFTVPVGPWLVAIYMGLWIAAFVAIVRRVGVIWSPLVWLGTEVLRSTLFGGLPWLLIGYTQHDALHLIQIADLGGIWIVSLLVAFVNAAIVDPRRGVKLAAAGLVGASVLYGVIRLQTISMSDGPTVAVVQPNIPQSLKLSSVDRTQQADDNYRKHYDLSLEAAAGKPDLIVWPEAAIYRGIILNTDGEPEWRKTKWYVRLLAPSRETGIPTLIGSLVLEEKTGKDDQYTNSALLVSPEKGVIGRYDKAHLVPFAETFGLEIFRQIVHKVSNLKLVSFRSGTEIPVWSVAGKSFGAQICYEAIFPDISREIARKGASFTVNISNDGWFEASAELDQILAMARFRSIENRMHVIRATNTGISAFIEPTGRIQQRLEVNGKVKEVGGVMTGRIRLTEATSLYRATGDWVAWLGLAGALAVWGRRIFVDRNKKSA